MPLGTRRRRQQACASRWSSLVIAWWVAGVVLIAGCNSDADLEHLYRDIDSAITWHGTQNLPVDEAQNNQLVAPEEAPVSQVAESEPVELPSADEADTLEYWGSSDDMRLIELPAVAEVETNRTPSQASDKVEAVPSPSAILGFLLQPVAEVPVEELVADAAEETSLADAVTTEPPAVDEPTTDIPPPEAIADVEEFDQPIVTHPLNLPDIARARLADPFTLPTPHDLSYEERRLLEIVGRESSAAATGVPTDARLDAKARKKIADAFALAQRGASYAAHRELIEVLRMISQARDAQGDTHTRSHALAAGLRALEEAEDFVPRGTQLEAELDLKVICASHRTPISRHLDLDRMIPRQMSDRYYRYAQFKLALAVAGEPAGSMALYTLGKLSSQLGQVEPDKYRMASRRAVAYQQASLLAHNENYLAAHELGVLLAETGHLPEAQNLLEQVARQQPNAVVYRNLARVQEELGYLAQAEAYREESTRLTYLGSGNPSTVEWVSPESFAGNGSSTNYAGPVQVAQRPGDPAMPPTPIPRPPGTPAAWK